METASPFPLKNGLAQIPETSGELFKELEALRAQNAPAAEINKVHRRWLESLKSKLKVAPADGDELDLLYIAQEEALDKRAPQSQTRKAQAAYASAVIRRRERSSFDLDGPLFPVDCSLVLFGARSLPSFPLDVLPGWVRSYVLAVSTRIQCSPDIPANAAIGLFPIATMRFLRLHCDAGPCDSSTNIYLLCIAAPTNGKTPSWKYMGDPFYRVKAGLEGRSHAFRERLRVKMEALKAEKDGLTDQLRALSKKGESEAAAEVKAQHKTVGEFMTSLQRVANLGNLSFNATNATEAALTTELANNYQRMACWSGEGAGWFSQAAKAAAEGAVGAGVFVDGWDATENERFRSGSSGQGKKHECTRPLLSVALAIQPKILQDLGGIRGFIGQGWAQRFLFAQPPSTVGGRTGRKPVVDHRAERTYRDNAQQLFELAFRDITDRLKAAEELLDTNAENTAPVPELDFSPSTIGLTRQAEDLLVEFYEKVEAEMRPGGRLAVSEAITEWAGKARDSVFRLAVVLHAIWSISDGERAVFAAVKPHAAQCAIKLGHYYLDQGLAALGLMTDSPLEADAKKVLASLLEWVREDGCQSFKAAEVQSRINTFKSRGEDAQAALELLEQCGYIAAVRWGRACTYVIRPDLEAVITAAEAQRPGAQPTEELLVTWNAKKTPHQESVSQARPVQPPENEGSGATLGGKGGGAVTGDDLPTCAACAAAPAMSDGELCEVCQQARNEAGDAQ